MVQGYHKQSCILLMSYFSVFGHRQFKTVQDIMGELTKVSSTLCNAHIHEDRTWSLGCRGLNAMLTLENDTMLDKPFGVMALV